MKRFRAGVQLPFILAALILATLSLILSGKQLMAQSPADKHSTEWAFTTGGAADLPGGVKGGEFWAMQLRWGKVLTAPHGPGPLRGTLEYAFELVPTMVLRQACPSQTTSTTSIVASDPAMGNLGAITATSVFQDCHYQITLAGNALVATFSTPKPSGLLYGGGFNPFFWQYNFAASTQQRFVPYFNLGAGMLFTTQDFPAGTSSFNFTPQGGIGAYWFAKPNRAVSFGVRYHHISNAGITKPNPGHNSLYFYGGLSWWR